MSNWIYGRPEFECDKLNYDLLRYAPWSGHRSFVYDFMNYLRPATVAELGSHYGCSAFTFCQADKDFNLGMDMYFVDTWQGDDFTKKYDNDVYTVFSKTVESFYSSQKVNMLRMTFDEAVDRFADKSIDLLHIDGSHHYDDVRHDFESWFPKVKENGVIMLHDVSSDIVLGDVMGSYKYWGELKEQFKNCVSFDFSWGLGIIFLSDSTYRDFISAVDLEKYQRANNALDVEFKDRLRQNYFELKDKQIYIDDLLKQKEILTGHLNSYKADTEKKESYIAELEKDKTCLNDTIKKCETERQNIIKDYEAGTQAVKTAYENTIADIKTGYENTLQGKDSYINELESERERLNSSLAQANARAAELEGQLDASCTIAQSYKTMYERTLTAKAKGLYHKICGKKGAE